MIRTRVGYAGGKKENPTYHSIGDHSETFQVDFDPARISYADLLAVFWKGHNPTRQPWSIQYKPAVFYHDDAQRQMSLLSKEAEAARRGSEILTEILPATRFYLAEDYHQKYSLQHSPELMAEFSRYYPTTAALIGSTAAARANGFMGGDGSSELLEAEINSYGLSPLGKQALRAAVQRFNRE